MSVLEITDFIIKEGITEYIWKYANDKEKQLMEEMKKEIYLYEERKKVISKFFELKEENLAWEIHYPVLLTASILSHADDDTIKELRDISKSYIAYSYINEKFFLYLEYVIGDVDEILKAIVNTSFLLSLKGEKPIVILTDGYFSEILKEKLEELNVSYEEICNLKEAREKRKIYLLSSENIDISKEENSYSNLFVLSFYPTNEEKIDAIISRLDDSNVVFNFKLTPTKSKNYFVSLKEEYSRRVHPYVVYAPSYKLHKAQDLKVAFYFSNGIVKPSMIFAEKMIAYKKGGIDKKPVYVVFANDREYIDINPIRFLKEISETSLINQWKMNLYQQTFMGEKSDFTFLYTLAKKSENVVDLIKRELLQVDDVDIKQIEFIPAKDISGLLQNTFILIRMNNEIPFGIIIADYDNINPILSKGGMISYDKPIEVNLQDLTNSLFYIEIRDHYMQSIPLLLTKEPSSMIIKANSDREREITDIITFLLNKKKIIDKNDEYLDFMVNSTIIIADFPGNSTSKNMNYIGYGVESYSNTPWFYLIKKKYVDYYILLMNDYSNSSALLDNLEKIMYHEGVDRNLIERVMQSNIVISERKKLVEYICRHTDGDILKIEQIMGRSFLLIKKDKFDYIVKILEKYYNLTPYLQTKE